MSASFDSSYELAHRYTRESGRVYLTGVQALVRLPLMQRTRDAAAGLNTAGFISGYRGSPLGAYDLALWQARELLEASHIRFAPGVNEDLAATAVWGSQQAVLQPGPRVAGVFAIWYGKGPGVDRSTDAIKHGNYLGAARHGGVLALCGDDPGGRSSSIAHQSEQALVHCGVPVLNPANVQEFLDLGLLGFALSRFSGCWVGFKCLTDSVDSAASVEVGAARVQIAAPDFAFPQADHHVTLNNEPLRIERQLWQVKLPAAQAFARANKLDRTVLDSPRRRLGIVSAGKAFLDLRQALADLGIDSARARELGIVLYKVAMTWPLEPEGLRDFCRGLEEVLVVEEKRPLIEEQLAHILYNQRADERPRLLGKRDLRGAQLLPAEGELSAQRVAAALRSWFGRSLAHAQLPPPPAAPGAEPPPGLRRLPAFCSGCPHNTSTQLPEGAMAMGGIGCHGMAVWLPGRRTYGATHMGGEGANWIGQAPYTELPHIFQNMGDGTYFHSGLLAIRACVAAGVNITFKLLVNGAVAMTGGQPIEGEQLEGEITTPGMVQQLAAEGVARIAVLSNEPQKYARGAFPRGVRVHHRSELMRVQEELRGAKGVSALIYDQTCAAEARRLRKQGRLPDPDQRIVINERVCEGCGDCSVQSNCISIEPVETEFGRKRRIDQSSCNKDYSCVDGYCPSFVSIFGGKLRRAESAAQGESEGDWPPLPPPPLPKLDAPWNVLVAGIGGGGVVTIGAILGMAAHLEGRGCSELDVTGLAQKNGPVSSHVRIAATAEQLFAPRIGDGAADLLLGCDLVVATNAENLPKLAPGRSTALVNSRVQPTADFASNADLDLSADAMTAALQQACGAEALHMIPAAEFATALLGDALYANMLLLGAAFQRGLLPVGEGALLRAIELNGRAPEQNRRAFTWGRRFVQDRAAVQRAAAPLLRGETAAQGLAEITALRGRELRRYQGARLEKRYLRFVARVAEREQAVAPGSESLACAAARYGFKVWAYKDEYEVARLYTDGAFAAQLAREFEGLRSARVHLSMQFLPGWLAPRHAQTGRHRKLSLPLPLMLLFFRALCRLRWLRGTPFDPFGWTRHRRLERGYAMEYERTVEQLLAGLSPGNLAQAVEIASLPEQVRGFDSVKEQSLAAVREKQRELLDNFHRAV
ncbi:MAG: indolepyruvate ferredoxin oxidoreductase family protein [Deltaproteobacteria bacterium]|nr:indolepyruvate ferredoxin oxidoreductase family protein [Deltaproteobacteria bacterium]